MIAGIINSKTINKQILKHVEFVAYELINDELILSQSDQFDIIKELGFKLVYYKKVLNINDEKLNKILNKRRVKSNYDVDGIIVTDNNKNARNTSGNPKYSIAFKNIDLTQLAEVKVIDVEWNLSKHGKYKPKILFENVRISNVNVKCATGHNAKYIVENKNGMRCNVRHDLEDVPE